MSERVNLPDKDRALPRSDKQKKQQQEVDSEEAGSSNDKAKRTKNGSGKRLDSLQKAQLAFKHKKEKLDENANNSHKDSKDNGGGGDGKKNRVKRVHAETKKGQPVMRAQISRMLQTLQDQQAAAK